MQSERWRLPPTLLPDGERRDLWAVDGRLTDAPVDHAAALPGRYALAGLVDAHAHVALGPAKEALDVSATTAALRRRLDEGVLAVRDVGAPHSVTLHIRPDPSLPRLQAAGRWFAPEGRFYPSFHTPVAAADLLAGARAEIDAGARWIKVIADWLPGELNYEAALLHRLVESAHAAGARVAAHTAEACVSEIVAAGVDSVEHGWLLTEADLDDMAARGAALTPTLAALHAPLPDEAPPERIARRRDWLDAARAVVPRAVARGVTVLAGTDTAGTVADEVGRLIDFGLTPEQALRAATTDARAFLGLPGSRTARWLTWSPSRSTLARIRVSWRIRPLSCSMAAACSSRCGHLSPPSTVVPLVVSGSGCRRAVGPITERDWA